jgi:hypothetical protein
MDEDVIGGRVSLVAEDGQCENFHRSARALPAARGHAGYITCRNDIAGHSLNSRLCRVPELEPDLGQSSRLVEGRFAELETDISKWVNEHGSGVFRECPHMS